MSAIQHVRRILRIPVAISMIIGTVQAGAALAAPSVIAHPIIVAQSSPLPSVQGEVTRVNKDTGKITIRHGPIPNLDMPPMTMVFALKDPAMIESVAVGSKISFTADRLGGAITVMTLESLN